MILHLYQDLPYRSAVSWQLSEMEIPCAQGYALMLKKLESCAIGTDACLLCIGSLSDEQAIRTCRQIAFSEPSSENTPVTFCMESGKYHFLQVPFPPKDGNDLEPIITQFLFSLEWELYRQRTFFIRLFKENPGEIALQFLAPIDTKEE
jgi:hypothetical protein